jgi:N-acetylglucosaminyldiphosphoundecaprenol N-acetyl-beta-D-mannosaminyltransferase
MINILNVDIHSTSYQTASAQIIEWAKKTESRYVCAANVHMVMEAYDHPDYREILNHADIVTPDGMPLVWIMRQKGKNSQDRVYGPSLMLHILDLAEKNRIPIGLYGSSNQVLDHLKAYLLNKYPGLLINYSYSPPFRDLTSEEDYRIIEQMKESGMRILFVGLGCPKQEVWMGAHKNKIPVVMIGVGAAFDFHAGIKPQASPIIQKLGLEWLFRLIHEPRRLWKRYLINNPRFIVLVLAELFGILPSEKLNQR